MFSPYSKSCLISLKMLIFLKQTWWANFVGVKFAWKTDYSALADAITVALSTAVTDLFSRSRQCGKAGKAGKARSIFGSLASLSKLSQKPLDTSNDTHRAVTKLIFYSGTLALRSSFLLLITLRSFKTNT